MQCWLPIDVVQPSCQSSFSLSGRVDQLHWNSIEHRSFKLTSGVHFCYSLRRCDAGGRIGGGASCPVNRVLRIPTRRYLSLPLTRKWKGRAFVTGSTAPMTDSMHSVAASAHASRETKGMRTPSASQLPLTVLPGGQLRDSMVDQALVWASLNGLIVGDAAVEVCRIGYIGLADLCIPHCWTQSC